VDDGGDEDADLDMGMSGWNPRLLSWLWLVARRNPHLLRHVLSARDALNISIREPMCL
jgi:hypothetical protein